MSLGTSTNFHYFLALLLPLLLTSQASEDCYWPDGSIMPTGIPCPSGVSCCSTNETCLQNGLCFNNMGDIYRGGCTDKNYGPMCPQACKHFMYAHISSDYAADDFFMNLEPCKMSGETTWCCAINRTDTASCCGNATLTVPTGLINGWLFKPQASPNSGGSSTGSSSSSMSSSSSSSTASKTGESTVTATVFRDLQPSATSVSGHKTSATAVVGLGVGIPLGIAAAAGWITVWVLVRRGGGKQPQTGTSKNGLEQWDIYGGDGLIPSAGRPMAQAPNFTQELGGTPYFEANR